MDARMSKLKIANIDDVVAIDIHTHAEEPCGLLRRFPDHAGLLSEGQTHPLSDMPTMSCL
jgi:hypothetical protein